MNRRDFFQTGTFLGAGLLAGGAFAPRLSAQTTAESDQRAAAKLRISSQLGIIPADSIPAKLEKMKNWGCEAVEWGGDVVAKAAECRKMADDAGLESSAICWGSHNGDLCSEDESKRQPGVDDLKKAIEAAGILGARGVIYVPAFNGQTKLTNQEIRARCLEFLPDVAAFAVEHKTHVIFEPLCRMEAYFLRQVADGASICRDINEAGGNGGMALMGDFYHMWTEETSDMGAFISGGSYLQHVHLAGGTQDPRRTLPGQNSRTFVDGFRGLKYIGYQQFCSFECGVVGDKEVEIPKSIAYLKAQWDAA